MIQSSRTLREAESKKGRCLVSGNGPLMFPRLLDVVAFSLWGSGFFIAADVSAGKNRELPSAHRFLPTKLQVADAQNRGLFDRSRFFTALLDWVLI